MIEITVRKFLQAQLGVGVYMEFPSGGKEQFVVLKKADTSRENRIDQATFVADSYAKTLQATAELNERVKAAVDSLIDLNDIASVERGSDYPAFDSTNKRYRYQALFNLTHY